MEPRNTEIFAQACGFNGPLTLRVSPGKRRVVMTKPFAVLGSDPGCDIVLTDEGIEPRHAYLQVFCGRLVCMDISESAGIEWPDGQRQVGRVNAKGVQIGSIHLNPPKGIEPSTALVLSPEKVGKWHLLFDLGRSKKLWRASVPVCLVGGGDACRVRLKSSSVRKYHASLVLLPNGLWTVDLGGGVRVNGRTVRVALLKNDDVIEFGKYRATASNRDRDTESEIEQPPVNQVLPAQFQRHPQQGAQMALADFSANPAAALVFGMMEQFQRSQAQMFEQFQQSTTGLFKMMHEFHASQRQHIEREWEHLRRLNEEMLRLQNTLVGHIANGNGSPSRPTNGAVPNGYTPPPSFPQLDRPSLQELPPVRTPAPAPPLSNASPQPVAPTDMSHDDIQSRIAAVQKEQTSTWQRILTLFNGD